MSDAPAPLYETLALAREGRLLTIALNRPEALNAVNLAMHDELAEVFAFAANDPHSDVVVLTGAGRAFSAGGDLDHLQRNAEDPRLFDHEIAIAKRIVLTMLDLDKPLVCRMNGHAIGLGATLALLCDVVFAAENAKIGDPHVAIGLAAGDGGAVLWPSRIGYARAKEYLLTGELLSAAEAAQIGLINRALPADALDAAVREFCNKLLSGAPLAIRATKRAINLGLKLHFDAVLEPGLDLERETVRSADHKEAIAAMREKRPPKFSVR
jgi:enoyl-CoA hydratase